MAISRSTLYHKIRRYDLTNDSVDGILF